MSKSWLISALACSFALSFCGNLPAEAQVEPDPQPANQPPANQPVIPAELVDPNGRQDLPAIAVEDRLKAQRAAQRVADEACADLARNKKAEAACLIRDSVRQSMTWSQEMYSYFILELNEQLEARNVLQTLGLHQRPHAATTSAQYKAELGLYGQRTLPAAILARIGPEAIRQGRMGDCWFLSTLAVVSNDYPHLIPQMISVNPDASYTVKFPGFSKPILVKALPYNSTRARGARATEYGDWPFVIECAATALFPEKMNRGGKANIALKLLTGADSNVYALSPNNSLPMLNVSDLSETVVAALETGQSVMLASKREGVLPTNHAYSVVDFIPANSEHSTLVSVRNPWGRLGFERALPSLPDIEAAADGRFTMPISSLPKYFNDIVVPKSAVRIRQAQYDTASNTAPQSVNRSYLPPVTRSYIPVSAPGTNVPQPAASSQPSGLPAVPRSYIRSK